MSKRPRVTEGPPHLGLVCITASEEVRFRTITRTRFLTLTPSQRLDKLRELYADNLKRVYGALAFCHAHHIRLYRMTSHLFPMDDAPEAEEVLNELAPRMKGFAARARRLNIRVIAHPEQFVVLNSESPAVVEASIRMMIRHGEIFDRFGLDASPWAALILHGGKGGRGDQLVDTLRALPKTARNRIALENDESAYSAEQILDICRRAGVPMIFDAHHHAVREKLDSYEHPSVARFTRAAATTWPDPSWQIVHISNGCNSFIDPRHSDLVHTMPSAFATVPWIEVEAKMKEQAIAQLRAMRWTNNNAVA